jgi:hypothetical protein
MAAETATVSAARGPGRVDLARFAAVELSIWSVVYGLYLAVRGVSIASPDEAFANARGVVDLERALGLYHEASFQSALRGVDEALSVYYLLGFAPLLVGVLVWLGISHRPRYRELRTLLLVSIGVAVVVHVTLPVAPPRLLPGLGIADTVGLDQNHDSLFGIPFNPYAAMPSMHVGWSLLVGLVALKASRSPVLRGFFALHPAMMAISVTATGNHYFLDSLAGALVALLALGLLRAVPATRSSVCRAVSSRQATSASTLPLIARVSCGGSAADERLAA